MRAFKFPGLARMLNLYCIFVYSVIDPSGTFILGLVLAVDLLSGVLIVSVTGMRVRCNYLRYSLSLTLDPVLVTKFGFILRLFGLFEIC